MKRKLFLLMTAILAAGLLLIACPTEPPPGPGPGTGSFVPPTDWVGFTDAEMEAASFYTGDGGEGSSITKNADGTFNVTIKTRNDGNKSSVVYFTFEETIFRNGYYVSLTLPNNAQYKPFSVDILPSETGDGTNGTWAASMNTTTTGHNPATFDADGNVIGKATFHWGNDEATYNFKTLAIWLIWAPTGEGIPDTPITPGVDYTFTINEIKVKPHDTSEPDPELEPWTQDPFVAQPGDRTWADFDSTTLTGGLTSYGASTITDNEDGTYTVKITTRAADSRIYFTSPDTFNDAYLSITLPETTEYKPKEILAFTATDPAEAAPNNNTMVLVTAPAGKYVSENVGIHVDNTANSANTAAYKTLVFYIRWHTHGEEGDYTFTLKALKIEKYDAGEPVELTPWTPDPVAEPNGWDDFVISGTPGFFPAGGSIVDNEDGTYTVTAKTRSDGHTEITFTADSAFKGGYYLSVTLPTGSANKVVNVTTVAKDTDSDQWALWASEVQKKSDGKYVEGKVDLLWDDDANTTELEQFILGIYWAPGVTADEDYVFTINSFKVPDSE